MDTAKESVEPANTLPTGDSVEVNELVNDSLTTKEKNISSLPEESSVSNTFIVVRNATNLGLETPPNTNIHLGFHQYEPNKLLPPLIGYEQAILVVRIPSAWLTFTNPAVKQRRIWGTDIYTDDSDVVAALIHAGKYTPPSLHPLLQEEARGNRRGVQDRSPRYDLKVTLRVVPRLQRYTGTVRHHIRSRDWAEHDGASFVIHQVEHLSLGTAYGRGAGPQRSRRINAFCQARKRIMQA